MPPSCEISRICPDLVGQPAKEIVRFFQDYKALEKKDVTVEQLHGRDYAWQVIRESIALYQDTFVVNS